MASAGITVSVVLCLLFCHAMLGGSTESKQQWSFKRQLSNKGWSGPSLEVEALRLLGLWRANLPYCVQPKVHRRLDKKTSPAILRPAVQAASVSSCLASPLSHSSVDALVTSSTSALEEVAAAEVARTHPSCSSNQQVEAPSTVAPPGGLDMWRARVVET